MRQADLKFISNKSDLIEQNQIIVVKEQTEKFKFSTILNKAFSSWVAKELIRLAAFTLFVFVFLSLINRNSSTTVFSIVSREQSEGSIFTKKQIPGLFPSLSKNWEELLTRWQLRLLNGPNGAQSFNQNKYQIQFKHFDQKQDVVYITKDNCKGHLIMNWQIYGNNIYFTEFVAPQDSMIIPNDPEDEKCIKQNGTVLELMKFSTVWTISQENSENSLFLLIQDINENNERANYVLIASESTKI